jgi:hypothetical protein
MLRSGPVQYLVHLPPLSSLFGQTQTQTQTMDVSGCWPRSGQGMIKYLSISREKTNLEPFNAEAGPLLFAIATDALLGESVDAESVATPGSEITMEETSASVPC